MQLIDLTVTEMANLIARRDVSPIEVVEAHIARAEAVDGTINSIVLPCFDEARTSARAAEKRLASGGRARLLEGIPVGIKDIIDVSGHPTKCASRLRASQAPAGQDAVVVATLRANGAIILAKLATHEFAMGGPSFDLPQPPARNPWNTAFNPGGSSTGSAAAVAAGIVPLAVGTDTSGSIRHPAGACGVVGFKPTYGLISAEGVFPLAPSLDHVGPICRTVDDAILGTLAFGGRLDDSKLALRHKGVDAFQHARVGYVLNFHRSDVIADVEVSAALDEAASRMASAGLSIETATLPPLQDFGAATDVLQFAESWSIHERDLCRTPEAYGESGRQRLMIGAFLSSSSVIATQRHRAALTAAVDAKFRTFDFLLTVNMMDPACKIEDAEALKFREGRQGRFPFNLTGHPAISLVSGISHNGLPLSLQIVAGRGCDDDLLAFASVVEQLLIARPAIPSTLLR